MSTETINNLAIVVLIVLVGAALSLCFRLMNETAAQRRRFDRLRDDLEPFFERMAVALEVRSSGGRGLILDRAPEEFAEQMADRLLRTPSLRRVFSFSISVSKEFARGIIGLTDQEIEEIDAKRVAPERIWPAMNVRIEQWDTRTVIYEGAQYLQTIYGPHHRTYSITAIWEHRYLQARNCRWSHMKIPCDFGRGAVDLSSAASIIVLVKSIPSRPSHSRQKKWSRRCDPMMRRILKDPFVQYRCTKRSRGTANTVMKMKEACFGTPQ